jgi:hypothetical protein
MSEKIVIAFTPKELQHLIDILEDFQETHGDDDWRVEGLATFIFRLGLARCCEYDLEGKGVPQ